MADALQGEAEGPEATGGMITIRLRDTSSREVAVTASYTYFASLMMRLIILSAFWSHPNGHLQMQSLGVARQIDLQW